MTLPNNNNKVGVIVNNKKWLALMLVATSSMPFSAANAEYYPSYPTIEPAANVPNAGRALPWWNERTMLVPEIQPHRTARAQTGNTPVRQHTTRRQNPGYMTTPTVHAQPASYQKPYHNNPTRLLHQTLNCQHANALNLPDRCILRSAHNRRGLEEQIKYLRTRNPVQQVARGWAGVSNAALLHTAHRLLHWERGLNRQPLQEQFFLRRIGSQKNTAHADYTGYFTPVVQVQSFPDQRYRFPIYAAPRNGTSLTRRQIEQGALRNHQLEIAWTDDRVNLFFAHTQGSAIARYPDGTERYLGYAGNNRHAYGKISRVLRSKGYMQGSMSNENIRKWLHANPRQIDEVLNYNQRYIFFSLSNHLPKTATGTAVLPGHTLAVDDHYIPLGAVLLAAVPRINHLGQRIGSDWRLLFAQDRGNAIKGPGRVDMYTGMGQHAEAATYQVTGLHQTYMLISKPNDQNVARM